MSKSHRPTIHCDAEDGECGNWDIDFYAEDVASVGGARVTRDESAPGWLTTPDYDLCPKHHRLARGES